MSSSTYSARVADIVGAPTTKYIVWPFNIVSAHVGSFRAKGIVTQGSPVRLLAQTNLILTSIGHGIGEFHIIVHSLVDLYKKNSMLDFNPFL